MLSSLRGFSPVSDTMSESALERRRLEKATIIKTPIRNQSFSSKTNNNTTNYVKNFSDKNGNDVSKDMGKGGKTFAFWTLVTLLFILTIGNLALTFTILAVLRLGNGMESMEFLPEQHAIKFFGNTDLDSILKKDGLLEGFRDVPMTVESDGGSVNVHLQSRIPRADSRLVVNSSGIFALGVGAFEVRDGNGEPVFSTSSPELTLPEAVNNLKAKSISTKRITSPIDQDLKIRSDSAIHLRGAEGTHLEAKELVWSADQDIYLKSINGSIILSGKEGVFVDVKYLPIASVVNRTEKYLSTVGQFKVCVCMPQGKLFRVPVPSGLKVSCSHINLAPDVNPCI